MNTKSADSVSPRQTATELIAFQLRIPMSAVSVNTELGEKAAQIAAWLAVALGKNIRCHEGMTAGDLFAQI